MPSNYSALPQTSLDMVAHELATKNLSMAERFCTYVTNKSTLSGQIPVRGQLLAMEQNAGLGRGAEAETGEMDADFAPYNCAAYVGRVPFHDEDETDWAAFGEDEQREAGEKAQAIANLNVDLSATRVMESTTLNLEFDVTSDGNGAWSDGGTASTPLKDMQSALITSPGYDSAIFGVGIVQQLIAHPDFLAHANYFNAGQLDLDAFSTFIAAKLRIPVQNVHVLDDRFYNSGTKAAPVTSHIFKDFAWLGAKANFHLVNPLNAVGNNILEFIPIRTKRRTDAQFVKYVDIIRSGGKDRGTIFTEAVA